MKLNIQKDCLANGIEVVHVKKVGTPPTVLAVMKAGSLYETDNNAGISHLTEHLMLMGTTSKGRNSRGEIYREIAELTGSKENFVDWLCYTIFDHIPLGLRVMREDIKYAMELIADILLRASIDAKKIEAEKKVVLEELQGKRDDTYRATLNAFRETIFKKYPLRRPVMGLKESVQGLTPQEICLFYKEFFIPQVLIVVGDVEFKETMKLTDKYFKVFPERKELKVNTNDEPENYSQNQRVIEGTHFHQSHLIMGLKVFKATPNEINRLELVGRYLDRKFFARTNFTYRSLAGYFGSPYFPYETVPRYGLLITYASFDVRHLTRVEEIMREEFLKLSSGRLDSKMIEHLARISVKTHVFAQEKSLDFAQLLQHYYLQGEVKDIQEYVSFIKNCTLEDFTDVVQKYVTPCVVSDSLTKVTLLP